MPLSLELGQHPDPDGTFSFYGRTPSGFDFEIGAGGQEIEPAGWREHTTDVTSVWGHKPKLGLQLRMAKELVVRGLGRLSAIRPLTRLRRRFSGRLPREERGVGRGRGIMR